MLKGTREVILRKVQPTSIHGQLSLDLYFVDPDDPDEQVRVARVGPETVPRNLQPGDRVQLSYVLGAVIGVIRTQVAAPQD